MSKSGLLPREGLTLEASFAPIRQTLLQPLLTGPVLFVLLAYPKLAAKLLSSDICEVLWSAPVLPGLIILFGVGVLRSLNSVFSRLVLNNFTTDKTWDWSKEIVLITGGSSGIGALVVQMLAERNVKVVILDIIPPRLETTKLKIHFYKTDITSTVSLNAAAMAIRKEHGHPSVLINNAGIGTGKSILDETEEELRRVFDVNTISHFLLAKEFVPAMIERNHGHIVTVASMASFVVIAQNVDYSCTKASALAFHEGLAQELKARYGASKIRTTVVHPTWTRTPLTAKLMAQSDFKELFLEAETVAEAIVNQVLSGYGGQIILPARLRIISLIRGLPSWLQEGIRNSGANIMRN